MIKVKVKVKSKQAGSYLDLRQTNVTLLPVVAAPLPMLTTKLKT